MAGRSGAEALAGLTVSEEETVFATADDSLTHPDYFSHVLDRHLVGSDLPRFRFHDIRHNPAQGRSPGEGRQRTPRHSRPAFTTTV